MLTWFDEDRRIKKSICRRDGRGTPHFGLSRLE